MAKRKVEKGPSWLEVGLGAFLSVVLGVVLGVAYMIAKPVLTVKEIPKDAPAGAVYYIEGSRSSVKSAGLEDKRKSFLAGESVDLDEGEVNTLLGDPGKPSTPGGKPGDKAPAPEAKLLDIGSLNVRIKDGRMQFAVPANFNVLTVMGTVIVQANGGFEKRGSTFTYVPDTLYVGGCPIGRIPFAKDWVMSKLLFARPVPDDIATAWSKLVSVSIEGTTLRLRTP
jgi:hypothetical protein